MDPLSDVLRVVRLDGAYFYAVEAAEPWRVETVAARELTPRIMPQVDHLISYHVVIQGHCFGGVVGEEPVALAQGDVIVFPHGDAHIMSSGRVLGGGAAVLSTTPDRYPNTVHLGPRGAPAVKLLCGFLGCDRRPFNPLLAALPRRMHLRGMSSSGLTTFTRQLIEDAGHGRAGAHTALTRLAELMFIEVLRRHLEELSPDQTGWLAGLRDGVVGRALALLHARPGHAWTLPELAREAASSRSSVAKRFTELLGEPPMQYLARWRMQVAANRLAQSGAKIAAIAAEVGYDSEAAFSRAFKRATGLAPGAWREARRASRS